MKYVVQMNILITKKKSYHLIGSQSSVFYWKTHLNFILVFLHEREEIIFNFTDLHKIISETAGCETKLKPEIMSRFYSVVVVSTYLF